MAHKQLSGAPAPVQDHRDRVIASLEGDLRAANKTIADLREELAQVSSESARGTGELRELLTPLHRALNQVFGVLDSIKTQSGPVPSAGNDAWEAWKKKLDGKAADFITELLVHKEMTRQQLMVATRCGSATFSRAVTKLNGAQLLNRNGGKYSLKQI